MMKYILDFIGLIYLPSESLNAQLLEIKAYVTPKIGDLFLLFKFDNKYFYKIKVDKCEKLQFSKFVDF